MPIQTGHRFKVCAAQAHRSRPRIHASYKCVDTRTKPIRERKCRVIPGDDQHPRKQRLNWKAVTYRQLADNRTAN